MSTSEPVSKPKQHHVWQHYLRSWARGGTVWCLQDERIFPTGTTRLAVINDFYKLEPWTEEDMLNLCIAFPLDRTHPILQKLHGELLQRVFSPLNFVEQNRSRLNNLHLIDDYLDVYRTNVIDEYHTLIEGQFAPLLPRLLNGDVSWYRDLPSCIHFLVFLCAQHMRTRAVKEGTIARLRDRMGLDISRIWDIAALMATYNMACSLFLERNKRTPRLIRNTTAVPFITGDQPTLNLHGDGETSPEALSFYYPLSPELALYLGEPDEPDGVAPNEPITAESISALNLKIAEASHSQVFAHAREPLQDIQAQLRGQ